MAHNTKGNVFESELDVKKHIALCQYAMTTVQINTDKNVSITEQ